MKTSKYNVLHALAAAIVMIAAVSNDFWHNFIHGGFTSPPPVKTLTTALAMQFALTGILLLVLWSTTFFTSKRRETMPANKIDRLRGISLAVKSFPAVCMGAFALQLISAQILEKVFHITAHGQDLVEWLKPGTYPLSIRLLLMLVATVEAPVMEELLFRSVMFRGLAKSLPAWAAMTLSGLAFAIVHVNAAALVPLWFLGIAFAKMYHATGTILAPMTAHFLFNLLNLGFVLGGITE